MPRDPSPLGLRLATLLLPPLGLVLLWRSSRTLGRKLLGTLGIALYSLIYAGFLVFLLVQLTPLQVEWRGGYVPALTAHKTQPDFDALERHRTAQAASKLLPAAEEGSSTWRGFRGNLGDGIYDRPILTNWPPDGLKLLWRQPCGGGYGSFCIANGKAYTIEQRRAQEAVVAYELQTGRELWTHGWPGLFSEAMGGDGPRSTPACAEGLIYALGAQGTLQCLQADTGQRAWVHNLLSDYDAQVPSYGVAASPLVIEDKLIVQTGAGHGHSVVCYDRADGKLLWHALDDLTGYATPALMTLAGEPQVVVCASNRTVGLRPQDGQLLWEYPWQVRNKQIPISQPIALGTNRFLLSAGYFTGAAGVEITRSGTNFTARTLWQSRALKNKFTSSVLWQDHIYGLDEDILTCLEAATGAQKWKDGRYGYGQLFLAAGHLVILSGEGELALVRAAPDHWQELARFPAIQGKTWNHPAIADGKLLVRNAAEMACFELGEK